MIKSETRAIPTLNVTILVLKVSLRGEGLCIRIEACNRFDLGIDLRDSCEISLVLW